MQTIQDGNLLASLGFWINVAITIISAFAAFVVKQLKYSDRLQWRAIDDIRKQLDTLQGEHNAHHKRK